MLLYDVVAHTTLCLKDLDFICFTKIWKGQTMYLSTTFISKVYRTDRLLITIQSTSTPKWVLPKPKLYYTSSVHPSTHRSTRKGGTTLKSTQAQTRSSSVGRSPKSDRHHSHQLPQEKRPASRPASGPKSVIKSIIRKTERAFLPNKLQFTEKVASLSTLFPFATWSVTQVCWK